MPVYKDKVRGTWYASFYYVDWNGERKKKKKEGFNKKSDAQEFERDFIKKQGGGSDMPFGSLVELYMEDSKSRVRSTTYENKKFLIDSKILPDFTDTPANTISPAMIRKWQNKLMSSESKYSQTYLKTVNNQMSAIFNFAVKYYGLPFNPVVRCGSMGKKHADAMKFWTKKEFDAFIDFYKDKDKLRFFYAFNLLFYTGIRSGEFLALTLNDFDFKENILHINKRYARIKLEDDIDKPKTPKSIRDITLPKFVSKIVQEYVNKLIDYEPSDRLFTCTKHTLQKELVHGCDYTGVKRIRIHDLRHSHASLLIEMGFSILLISERLGHDNIETTLRTYSHLYPNKHSEVAKKLDALQK
jgi:integrase